MQWQPHGLSLASSDRCPLCREPLYSPAETDAPVETTSWGAERPERPWVPILDAQGRTTGWRGPTCARRRDESGAQLPLEQEGADRG
jgi:hypothetical protein